MNLKDGDPPLFDEEDFDGEEWDDVSENIVDFLKCTSFREWVDLMTPIWQSQIIELKKHGFMKGKGEGGQTQ
jgi:hypothetical protein